MDNNKLAICTMIGIILVVILMHFQAQPENLNLAQQIVKDIPELQSICDSTDGCQNVNVTYTKYGPNNDSAIANQTFWHIDINPEKYVGDKPEIKYDMGIGYTTYQNSSNKDAIKMAIDDFWKEYNNSNPAKSIQTVPMNCDNNCWKK
jgi:hypothetical protein